MSGGIGGGIANGPQVAMVLISKIVAVGNQTTIDFLNIPQNFTSLRLLMTSRDTQAGSGLVTLRLRLNGDSTSTNYSVTARTGSSNQVNFANGLASSALGGGMGANVQDGNAAGLCTNSEANITGYSNTIFHKRVFCNWQSDDPNTGIAVTLQSFRWISTAAINQLTVLTEGTGFKNGSIACLYGIF